MSDWGALLSGIGDLLVGLGAIAAVVAGAVGGSRELSKRRKERDDDRDDMRRAKRAEVAAQLAVAVQRLMVAMQVVASPFMAAEPGAPRPTHEETAQRFQRRWDEAAPHVKDFIDAWNLAKIFLPDEVDALCVEIWRFRSEVLASQQTWFANKGAPGYGAFYERGIGSKPMERARELEDKALSVLRPYAQLHPTADAHAASRASATSEGSALPPTREGVGADGGHGGESRESADVPSPNGKANP